MHTRSRSGFGALSIVTFLCAATSGADAIAQGRGAQSSRVVVGPDGTLEEHATSNATFGGTQLEASIPGALWTRGDNGAGWVPKTVSVGVQGSQVFTEIEYGTDHNELISAFSPDPALPVWEGNVPVEATNTLVDSSETGDVHVSLRQMVQNGNTSTRLAVVAKYSSGSANADWSWTFPGTTSGFSRIAVSGDGSRIVAGTSYPSSQTVKLAIFTPGSGNPIWTGELTAFGTQLRGFDLSQDGSLLYVASNTRCTVFNTNTHQPVGQFLVPGGFDCHALAGDGRAFAWGEFGKLHLFERQHDGTYAQTWVREYTGPLVAYRCDFSGDGATLVYGFGYYDQNLKVRIEAVDVPSKTILMVDEPFGTGSYQNALSDISVSRDGQRFAVGLWGDQGNICPEVRLYNRNQSTPAATFNLVGSCYDLDMSADGERVAVAWKSTHANTLSGGGGISLFAFEPQDLRIEGVPSIGQSITVRTRGPSNASARLLWARNAATTPSFIPGAGVLYLNRFGTTVVPMPNSDSQGYSSVSYGLPGQASQIGTNLYFQGYFENPRKLTEDWARVTILP